MTIEEMLQPFMKRQDVWNYHVISPLILEDELVIRVAIEYGKTKIEDAQKFELHFGGIREVK